MRFSLIASRLLSLSMVALFPLCLRAEGPYVNRDYPDPKDTDEPTYPIPYQKPTPADITADLLRIVGYLETAAPGRVIDRASGATVDLDAPPVATAVLDRGEGGAFSPVDYTMGVTHSGMLAAAAATGNPRFSAFTASRLAFLAKALPYFQAQEKAFGPKPAFRAVLRPAALDDCGAMCAALIQARLQGIGPDLSPIITRWSDYISTRQFRLPDGTLARPRPQAASLWADDFYMGVPALAERGAMTHETRYFDDAATVALHMSERLFRPATGLYTHGWNANNPDAPAFYWGRANGWALLTYCDLLDVLPETSPYRAALLARLRDHIRGVAQTQSGQGLWHQMLDRPDSYLESSATAMFVYGIAHAINRGWISPVTYGPIAQAGWCGLSPRINARGQVEGTCVGTTFASDEVYYYARPASPLAPHGYGPTLLAGAEMIRLLTNPTIDIQTKLRTYHYVPRTP